MASDRRSRGYHRRQEEARERRRQRIIVMSVGGVLAVVAVVLVIGFIVSELLPPRATALVVGDRSYSARDVADRAIAQARMEGSAQVSVTQLVDRTIDDLIRQELLRQAGVPLVGEPDPEEIEEYAREQLGLGEVDEEEFETMYPSLLGLLQVSQEDFERAGRAQVTATRLEEHFAEDIPAEGPQLHLLVASSRDRAQLDELHERVGNGEAFAEVALELGLVEDAGDVDAAWHAEDLLSDTVRMAVEAVDAGALSQVVQPAGSLDFVVYFVVDRADERAYTETMRQDLAFFAAEEFLDEQREVVGVEQELSSRGRDWILRRVRDALSG